VLSSVDMLALGYLDRPAAQAEQLPRRPPSARPTCSCATASGGWRFAGREDTLLKIKGRWVNLNDLEERLGAGRPGLTEGAAVRWPTPTASMRWPTSTCARDGSRPRSRTNQLRDRVDALPHAPAPAVACTRWTRCRARPPASCCAAGVAQALQPELMQAGASGAA
jgi:hypothetical protein